MVPGRWTAIKKTVLNVHCNKTKETEKIQELENSDTANITTIVPVNF